MKVVEIVDRYDTDCVPESSRANKVAYIQSEGDNMCNRTITVDIFFYGCINILAVLLVMAHSQIFLCFCRSQKL